MANAGSDALVDAMGVRHAPAEEGARIVSLVPSITELICDLGLAANLVGRTGFCIHPKQALRNVPKVGGTKTADLAKIKRLAPTHVILNIDENPKEIAEALAEFVPNLIVTHPQAPLDNLALYRLLGGIFGKADAAEKIAEAFSAAYANAVAAHTDTKRLRVLYLIWKGPWMTVAPDTYISRTLSVFGLDTVPAQYSERYPKVDLEAASAEAEAILLSSEPYRFREKHVDELRALPYLAGKTVSLIDGEMTSWYGTRAISGLAYLTAFRSSL